MEQAEIIAITREAVIVTLKIATPVMMVGLAVGLTIALVQALTQVQEMTLAFVPKIVAIFLAIFFLLPFMTTTLIIFMESLSDIIIGGG